MTSNVFLNLLACGLILSSPVHAAPWEKKGTQEKSDWKSYTSTQNNYSVEFPSDPEHIEQVIEVPKTDLKIAYNTFISEPNEEAVYVVSVWDYPSQIDMSKPEVNLQDGFGGMLSALPGSEVQSMEITTIQGYKALQFLVKNEDIYFQGMLLLVNNTLYQVFTVYKDGQPEMKANYNRFIDSFKLLDATKKDKKNKKIDV